MKYHQKNAFFNPMITGEDIPESTVQLLLSAIPKPVGVEVNMTIYLRSILGSSLGLMEKFDVLDSIPTNTQFQVDSLQQVFSDEYYELGHLTHKYWPFLCEVGARNWVMSNMLADHYAGTQFRSSEVERSEVSCMLHKKYQGVKMRWAEEALRFNSAVVQHVYRAFRGSKLPNGL